MNISTDSLVDYSADGAKAYYKKDYVSIIEAAVVLQMIKSAIFESEILVKKETQIIPARTIIAKTPEGKPLRDENGEIIKEEIPEKEIVTEKSIIEAPNHWWLSSENHDGKVIIEDKILYSNILKSLTKGGKTLKIGCMTILKIL